MSGVESWTPKRLQERGSQALKRLQERESQAIKRRRMVFATDLVLILIAVTCLVLLLLQALNVIDVSPW
jgi:hypothetical protein